MGISIQSRPHAEPISYPIGIDLVLTCDDAKTLLCIGSAAFRSPDGFVGCHSAAMDAGWLERNTEDGRLWLCPECSGKKA